MAVLRSRSSLHLWTSTCFLGLQQWLSLLTLWQVPVWHGLPSRWTPLADSLVLLSVGCGILASIGITMSLQRGLVERRTATISFLLVVLGMTAAVAFVIGFRMRVVP